MAGTDLRSSLVPPGLVVEAVEIRAESMVVTARSRSAQSTCPSCGAASGRVHSRYRRSLGDLPSHGRAVRILVRARRFRCSSTNCRTRIFAERFDTGITRPLARRTERLEHTIHHLGLALGGRPAASLARRLMLPASKDTMLRTVRRRAVSPTERPEIIGIDDWAWKRGQRYGTILCDLERRRIFDLLPDRESASVERWLGAHAGIRIIARDRGGAYGAAAARACPDAIQVADRWHLIENASAAFLDAVRKSMKPIRAALGVEAIEPELLTSAEKLQYEGYRRREAASAVIKGLIDQGVAIKQIVRRTGHCRKVVRDVARGGGGDIFRTRQHALEPYLARLDAEWDAGCRNGAELWRRMRAAGFAGGLRVVTEWATRKRRATRRPKSAQRCPAARSIVRLMTTQRDHLGAGDALIVATIETVVPGVAAARDLSARFHELVRRHDSDALRKWIDDATGSLLSSFAAGIGADPEPVYAALQHRWSNGQTEGQITKLKLVKRQMYGRGKLDLLRARLLGVEPTPPLHQE